MTTVSAPTLLTVEDLRVYFRTRGEPIRAVDGVSLAVRAGETAALVGESGCGKSVTALSLARLVAAPGYVAGGRVCFGERDLLQLDERALRQVRGAEIAYIFQEPASALNPVFRVGFQIEEAIRLHRHDADPRAEAIHSLHRVGLTGERLRAYPQELSGGMQQRVVIAMALACRPKLLVADEPTTALDVTIQAQILDLLMRLQSELGMAMLLITHNLGLVAEAAHGLYVMYAGRIVESGPTEMLLRRPAHPYTRGLLAAVPRLRGGQERMPGIPGAVPHPARPPSGCPFHPRCDRVQDPCRREAPGISVVSAEHRVRCHYWK